MYDCITEVQKFVDKLDNSFVLTNDQVVYIKTSYCVSNIHFFKHTSHLYTEITVIVDAVRYSIEDGKFQKQQVQTLYLTLDTSEIMQATQENTAVLMLSDCRLTRKAAQDFYQTTLKVS